VCREQKLDKKNGCGYNPQPIIEEVSAHQKQNLAKRLGEYTALLSGTEPQLVQSLAIDANPITVRLSTTVK